MPAGDLLIFSESIEMEHWSEICQHIQKFSWEYCEIFKNTYFEENLQTAASTYLHIS